MTSYPSAIDSDADLPRVDDNITEIGGLAINSLRDAVFAVETALGINPQGSLASVANRLDVSLNSNGTIKASALSGIGLVTLPITNTQVGNTAGILESKLSLDFGTSHLNTLIQANSTLLASLSAFEAALETKLNSHIAGGPASNLRHVASHIDINADPSDSRDSGFTWTGLIDKDGYDLTATNVASALLEINNNLTGHQNQVTGAHDASAIAVDTSLFNELLQSSDNVQKALQNIDNVELLQLGTHREVQHSNGVPTRALSLNLNSLTTIGSDGYNIQVVSPTPVTAHVAHSPPGTSPVDNITNGDSVVAFNPTSNTGSVFDAQFSQVKVGDIIRINYGIGIEDLRRVESIKYIPGTTWVVRVNGVNLRDTDGYAVFARIDRPLYDTNTTGVLAVAAANAVPLANYSILGSVIVGDPRGANAIGINFNPAKITRDNYFLYLQLYPSGDPSDHTITLPGIDVSGNAGQTTGRYTLETVVQETNNAFRKTGYNYRFIAHAVDGNFAISLADSIDGAAFAIINGSNSTGSLIESTFTKNVVGDVYGLGFDGLGFGINNANIASPAYQGSWVDSTAAQIPTKVIHPVKSRNYIVNGRPFDNFKAKPLTTNGFWAADIDARTVVGSSVEVTYKVNAILDTAGLKPGKTIVVQPAVSFSDGSYNDVDYGRFIIKEVVFNPCECLDEYTLITVISGIHGTGNATSSSAAAGLPVRLYFGEDSVSFDDQNIIDVTENATNYHRHFEVYITDTKTTFSHERARMPYQTASGNLITSNFFHIDSVSPKFRGYRDSGATLNKYIRFYVLNYNSTTGEFDGYLGQRNASDYTISKTGPIIRARKNVTTRFYDDTNVDYIDITFIDESTSSPGLTVSTGATYVDIELFDSLALDGELLLLATCEVNWNPDTGKNIVYKVVDRKQHGSISEFEFTESAKDYIASGEKHLHGNGVIKGFDLDISGKIQGGLALVNGKFVITNPTTINIPLCTNNASPPQTLDWIVCVNESSNLITMPLTASKGEFFAKDGYSGTVYYIDSTSFIELTHRKDLTPLYIYNVTVTTTPSIVINSMSDVRKYVKDETSLIPLVWAGKDGYDTDTFSSVTDLVGHFKTFEQVENWINWTKSPSNQIRLRGTINSSAVIDLTKINYPTIFDGSDGCLLKLNSFRGMKLASGITLKNISFQWSPGTQTYVSGDNVNLDPSGSATNDLSGGCLYANGDGHSKTMNDVIIDNCKFTGIFPQTQRPPYITFVGNSDSNGFENIKITNNKFIDPTGVTNQSAIAFYNAASFIMGNSLVDRNVANHEQSIIFTNSTEPDPMKVANTFVTRNNVGAIGFMISDYDYQPTNTNLTEDYSPNLGMIIADNTAIYIGTLNNVGKLPARGTYFGIGGNVVVERNFCNVIYAYLYPTTTLTTGNDNSLVISNNHLKPKKLFSDLTANYGLATIPEFNVYTGIYVDGDFGDVGTSLSEESRSIQILDNTVGFYRTNSDVLTQFNHGIFVGCLTGTVSRNILKKFIDTGVVFKHNQAIAVETKLDVSFNQFFFGSDGSRAFFHERDSTNVYMNVVYNFFDTVTIDPLDSGGFDVAYSDLRNNTNQPFIERYRANEVGQLVESTDWVTSKQYTDLIDNVPTPFNIAYGGRSSGDGTGNTFAQLSVGITHDDRAIAWIVPLGSIITENARFVSSTFDYEKTGLDSIKVLTMRLMKKSHSSTDDTILYTTSFTTDGTSLVTGTLTLTPSTPVNITKDIYLVVDVKLPSGGGTNGNLIISDLICNLLYN